MSKYIRDALQLHGVSEDTKINGEDVVDYISERIRTLIDEWIDTHDHKKENNRDKRERNALLLNNIVKDPALNNLLLSGSVTEAETVEVLKEFWTQIKSRTYKAYKETERQRTLQPRDSTPQIQSQTRNRLLSRSGEYRAGPSQRSPYQHDTAYDSPYDDRGRGLEPRHRYGDRDNGGYPYDRRGNRSASPHAPAFQDSRFRMRDEERYPFTQRQPEFSPPRRHSHYHSRPLTEHGSNARRHLDPHGDADYGDADYGDADYSEHRGNLAGPSAGDRRRRRPSHGSGDERSSRRVKREDDESDRSRGVVPSTEDPQALQQQPLSGRQWTPTLTDRSASARNSVVHHISVPESKPDPANLSLQVPTFTAPEASPPKPVDCRNISVKICRMDTEGNFMDSPSNDGHWHSLRLTQMIPDADADKASSNKHDLHAIIKLVDVETTLEQASDFYDDGLDGNVYGLLSPILPQSANWRTSKKLKTRTLRNSLLDQFVPPLDGSVTYSDPSHDAAKLFVCPAVAVAIALTALNSIIKVEQSDEPARDGSLQHESTTAGPTEQMTTSSVGQMATSSVGQMATSPVGHTATSPVGHTATPSVDQTTTPPVGQMGPPLSPHVSQTQPPRNHDQTPDELQPLSGLESNNADPLHSVGCHTPQQQSASIPQPELAKSTSAMLDEEDTMSAKSRDNPRGETPHAPVPATNHSSNQTEPDTPTDITAQPVADLAAHGGTEDPIPSHESTPPAREMKVNNDEPSDEKELDDDEASSRVAVNNNEASDAMDVDDNEASSRVAVNNNEAPDAMVVDDVASSSRMDLNNVASSSNTPHPSQHGSGAPNIGPDSDAQDSKDHEQILQPDDTPSAVIQADPDKPSRTSLFAPEDAIPETEFQDDLPEYDSDGQESITGSDEQSYKDSVEGSDPKDDNSPPRSKGRIRKPRKTSDDEDSGDEDYSPEEEDDETPSNIRSRRSRKNAGKNVVDSDSSDVSVRKETDDDDRSDNSGADYPAQPSFLDAEPGLQDLSEEELRLQGVDDDFYQEDPDPELAPDAEEVLENLQIKCKAVPEVTQLTPERVQWFCKIFGVDANTWDPSESFPVRGVKDPRWTKERELARQAKGASREKAAEALQSGKLFSATGQQVFSAMLLYGMAGKYISYDDASNAIQRLYPVLATEPGLGKTAVAVICFVLNLLFLKNAKDIEDDLARASAKDTAYKSKHCPPDAPASSRCQSDWFAKSGLVCMCEPDSPTKGFNHGKGLDIVVAPPNLICGWENEFDKVVDVEAVEQLTGYKPFMSVAYRFHQLEHELFMARQTTSESLLTKELDWSDWELANPGMNRNEIQRYILLGKEKTKLNQPPAPTPLFAAHMFVVTTPLCLEKYFVNEIIRQRRPTLTERQFRCPVRQRTSLHCLKDGMKVNPETAGYKNHAEFHWMKDDNPRYESYKGMLINRIWLDEFHLYASRTASIPPLFTKLSQEQFHEYGSYISLIPISGTPFQNGVFDMMHLLEAQHISCWDDDMDGRDDLKCMSAPEVKDAEKLYGMMLEMNKEGKIGASSLNKFGFDYDKAKVKATPLSQIQTQVMQKFVDEYMGVLSKLIIPHMIRLKGEDEYNGKPMLKLPPMIQTEIGVDLSASAAQQIRPFIEAFQKDYLAYQAASDETSRDTHQAASNATHRKFIDLTLDSDADEDEAPNLQALARKVKTGKRHALAMLSIPALAIIIGDWERARSETGSRDHDPLLAGTIKEKGWFETPEKSPFWPILHLIYQSSAKIQRLIELLADRKTYESTPGVPASAEYCKERKRRRDRRKKVVIMVAEPVLGLCLNMLLKLPARPDSQFKAGSPLHEIRKEIKHALHGDNCESYRAGLKESTRSEINTRFQDEADARAHDFEPEWKAPDIGILIVHTRVGGTGITLTKADTVIHFDVELIGTLAEQVPKRCHRITQEHEVKSIQLYTKDFGVEQRYLTRRKGGRRLLNGLPFFLKGATTHQGSTVEPAKTTANAVISVPDTTKATTDAVDPATDPAKATAKAVDSAADTTNTTATRSSDPIISGSTSDTAICLPDNVPSGKRPGDGE